ncbi:hypothetical protein H8356DRAFT_1432600 [Neocallimastix lanati (nom. inval.)]|nr:hypothetical protein H8356DRAFT_1432600 [Neocallimastix sp. JGI-2020a]
MGTEIGKFPQKDCPKTFPCCGEGRLEHLIFFLFITLCLILKIISIIIYTLFLTGGTLALNELHFDRGEQRQLNELLFKGSSETPVPKIVGLAVDVELIRHNNNTGLSSISTKGESRLDVYSSIFSGGAIREVSTSTLNVPREVPNDRIGFKALQIRYLDDKNSIHNDNNGLSNISDSFTIYSVKNILNTKESPLILTKNLSRCGSYFILKVYAANYLLHFHEFLLSLIVKSSYFYKSSNSSFFHLCARWNIKDVVVYVNSILKSENSSSPVLRGYSSVFLCANKRIPGMRGLFIGITHQAGIKAFSELDQWLKYYSNDNILAIHVEDFNISRLTQKGSKSSCIDHDLRKKAPHVYLSSVCTSLNGNSDHKPINLHIYNTKCDDIISHNYFSALANDLESISKDTSANEMAEKNKAFVPSKLKRTCFSLPHLYSYLDQFTKYHKLCNTIRKIKNLFSPNDENNNMKNSIKL